MPCALAALATTAASPLAVVEADASPRVRDFTLRLDGADRPARVAGPASAGLRTRVLRAPHRFDLVGLTADALPAGLHAHVRTRQRGGRWTAWEELEIPGLEDGRPGRPRATEPMWVGGADELQVRTSRPARSLRAFFVDTSGVRRRVQAASRPAMALAGRPLASIAQAGPAPAPAIVPRARWAGNACAPRARPAYGRAHVALVHHTVSANSYTPQESAAMVLGICRYHRNALKWNDIGYPFLVDRYGQIFEGRAGGVDRPVIGAHAQGFNSVATGVATLGTFESVAFPPAGLRAIARLLAWKLPVSGAPTQGLATVRSAGGSASRFAAGATVRLYRISAHRDVGRTSCPGGVLYRQMGSLRAMVGGRTPLPGVGHRRVRSATALTAAGAAAAYPGRSRVSGRLARGGSGVPRALVRIDLKRSTGRYRRVATTRTDSSGRWSTAIATAFSRTMRAVYRGDAAHRPSRSRAFRVRVAARIALRTTTLRARGRQRVSLRGTLQPIKRARLRVIVQRRARGGRYTRGRSVAVRPRGARFLVRMRLTKPSLYRFRARFDGDGRNTAAQTRLVFVRVLSPR